MVQMSETTSCLKCGKPGTESSGELTPDKGRVIKVNHSDGTICEFVEYDSISTFLDRGKRTPDLELKKKKIMKCPVCGEKGRVGNYRRNKNKKFYKWSYLIVHEEIGGFWGKNKKVKRVRRCYMKTEDQTNQILKRLGRSGDKV